MSKNVKREDLRFMQVHGIDAAKATNPKERAALIQEAVEFASLANNEDEAYCMRFWMEEGVRNYCADMVEYHELMGAYDEGIKALSA